jgi:RimJ/RimL family protein N-acetyltransferase
LAVTTIKPVRIRTERLDLIPATLELLESDRNDRRKLARLLDAEIPGSWPPPLLDDETLVAFIQMMAEGGDPLFAAWYWVLDDPAVGGRVLIGTGGTATPPTVEETEDRVLIGYSVLDEFQGRGYATEAVRHLITAIFSIPGIRRIEAATYPDLAASIQVLEKNGFVRAGEGFEEGTVAYVLENPGASV